MAYQAGLGRPGMEVVNWGGWPQLREFWVASLSPDLGLEFLGRMGRAALVTLAYAVVGTALSVGLGLVECGGRKVEGRTLGNLANAPLGNAVDTAAVFANKALIRAHQHDRTAPVLNHSTESEGNRLANRWASRSRSLKPGNPASWLLTPDSCRSITAPLQSGAHWRAKSQHLLMARIRLS